MNSTSRAKTGTNILPLIVSVGVLLALIVAFSPIPGLFAAPGDLDASFGTDGKVTTSVTSSATGINHGIALHSDGKILMVGGRNAASTLARYNVDGSLDTGFGTAGKVNVGFEANAVAIQYDTPNGDVIVVVGTKDSEIAVARYNSNGTPDAGFGTDGKVFTNLRGGSFTSAIGTSVALDISGDIYVGGYVQNGSEFEDFLLMRYSGSDGALDTSFNTKGWVSTSMQPDEQDFAYAIALQPVGNQTKIVLIGATKGDSFAMARYNPDGTLDTGFGTGGKVFGPNKVAAGYGGAIQEDGKIVVTGAKAVTDQNSANCTDSGGRYCEYMDFYVARHNVDGSLDTSFGTGGEMTTNINARGNDDHGRGVAIQDNGKIVVVGYSDTGTHTFQGEDTNVVRVNRLSVVRYNSDGSLDTSFSGDAKDILEFGGSQEEGRATLLQTDGKIVVGGPSGNSAFALARYDGDTIAPTPTPTETSVGPTATPAEEPAPTATPTPVPGFLNAISTRAKVGTGGDILIAGIIVRGETPVRVVIRAKGPSLPAEVGVRLADPKVELFDGSTKVAENNDWRTGNCANISENTRPGNDKESCLIAVLQPNRGWTALVSGADGGTGVGIVEVYRFDE